MITIETYQKPTIEIIDLELEAAILAGSDQGSGIGWE